MNWTKEKTEDGNSYVSGDYRIEPIVGGYWKWILVGNGLGKTFAKLSSAKSYVEIVLNTQAEEGR